MTEFFTWELLGTYAGAVLVATLITQFTKDWFKMPTQLFSYIVAVVVLVASSIVGGNADFANIALCLVNGVVVSLASNGAYSAVTRVAGK